MFDSTIWNTPKVLEYVVGNEKCIRSWSWWWPMEGCPCTLTTWWEVVSKSIIFSFRAFFQGGLVGAVGDDILTMVGEDVLEKHKVRIVINFHVLILDQGMLKELVKKRFREKASVFLGDQDNFLQSFLDRPWPSIKEDKEMNIHPSLNCRQLMNHN